MTDRGRRRRWLAVAVVVIALVPAASGAAAGAAPTDPLLNTTGTATPTASLAGTLDDTTDDTLGTATPTATLDGTSATVNDTTDSLDDSVDATTDSVDGTADVVDGTTDAVDGTVDDTTDVVDSTSDTVVDTTGDTLDDTTDAIDDTTLLLADGSVVDTSVGGTDSVSGTTEADLGVTAGDGLTAATGGSDERRTLATALTARTVQTGTAGSTPLPAGPEASAAGATALAGLSAVAAGSMLGGGTGIERAASSRLAGALERLVRMVAPFRYSRYDGSDPLAHEDRSAIHEYVTEHPGAYASAVSDAVGVNHSTARHHVKVLQREGLVEDAKVRGRRRLFPAHAQQQELAAAMADESTAEVLEAIARLGPCSGSAVAEAVDRSVSTVSHHLSRLEGDGLVDREKDGRTMVNSLPGDVQEALAPEREPVAAEAHTVSAD